MAVWGRDIISAAGLSGERAWKTVVAGLAVAWLAGACSKQREPAVEVPELTGTFTVGGAAARLERCRPGHGVHVFVEIDTSLGTLRFGEGKLFWDGTELACQKLDRSWGGGVRQDGSAYFRGTLAFRCGNLAGDLTLDCGRVTAEEGAELARNRAAARAGSATPAGDGSDARSAPGAAAPDPRGPRDAGDR